MISGGGEKEVAGFVMRVLVFRAYRFLRRIPTLSAYVKGVHAYFITFSLENSSKNTTRRAEPFGEKNADIHHVLLERCAVCVEYAAPFSHLVWRS